MKEILFAAVAALLAGPVAASFGPLSPSAKPCEREYIWPEGKMPDVQAHQVAAKREETKAPGFRADDFRRPYLEWYAPNPATGRVDLCVLFISGGGFETCCDAARMQPAIDRFVRAGVTVASLTYRTPRPRGLAIHQSGWEDAQRAVRVIRSQAAKRGFGPDRIAATGISAGAKLVLLLATSSRTRAYAPVDAIDELPCNLLFAIPQAPAYVLSDGATGPNARQGDSPDVTLVPEFAFDAKTCPMCFFQGGADEYSPLGSTRLYRRLRQMKIPAELHLFGGRPHGFHGDLNRGADGAAYDHWFDRAMEFVRQMNYDGRLGAEVKLEDRFASDADRASCERQEIWPAGLMPDVQTNQGLPYIEWHLPKVRRTTAIQIVYSGGGYERNRTSHNEVAPARRYLNAKGMTVVTLRYRAPRPEGLAKHVSAWQDLQRAIRVVRSGARARGLDPERIGIMGSSAGGHLTLMGATSSRRRSYRPVDALDDLPCNVRWAVAIYPAYALTDGLENPNATGGNDDAARLAPEFSFDLDTCPTLFLHGDADGWAAMNSVKCWEQLRRMGISCDLHTFATRGHCFHREAAPGTGSYTYLDRIWEFLNGQSVSTAPACPVAGCEYDAEASDEFNGPELDGTRWDDWVWSFQGRRQGFLFARDNVAVANGCLNLTARPLREDEKTVENRRRGFDRYATAIVKAKRKTHYGYYECRAKAMKACVCNAFWLYDPLSDSPAKFRPGDFSEEIDIFEIFGAVGGDEKLSKPCLRTCYHTVHCLRTPYLEATCNGGVEKLPAKAAGPKFDFDFWGDFHTFGFLWTERELVWFVDGKETFRRANDRFHRPMHLTFDCEIMFGWAGEPLASDLPAVYSVDYFRHWRR